MTKQETKVYPKGVATWVRDAADLAGNKVIFNNEVTYEVGYCGDYALYYLNSYGGWDSFLIEGNVKRVDNLNSLTYERWANNNTSNFEVTKYQVGIEPTYECHTGWLTDEQAANFAKNLLSTTQAYLHDLTDNKIMPVIVEANSATYKTFKNNEKKLINYTFNVKLSQKQVRR